MDDMKSLLQQLQGKYGSVRTLFNRLSALYGSSLEKKSKMEILTFVDDADENRKRLEEQIHHLQEEESGILCLTNSDNDHSSVEYKLIKKYAGKLEKLTQSRILADGYEIAVKFCEALVELLKLWKKKGMRPSVEMFLSRCGVRAKEFPPGYHLEDDDYSFLDDKYLPLLKVETTDQKRDGEVIEMKRPIFQVRYQSAEDEEIGYVCVPGICSCYVYKR